MEGINDKHEFYNPYKSVCGSCKNGFDFITFSCKAFPKGIPELVLTGEDNHSKPLKEQGNALVYTPI